MPDTVTVRWEFQASGDACPVCSALNGQVFDESPSLPHEGCKCQVIPMDEDAGCPSYSAELGGITQDFDLNANTVTTHYGFEITVICCDDSEIQQSIEYTETAHQNDLGEFESPNVDIDIEVEAMAWELASQCPPNVVE